MPQGFADDAQPEVGYDFVADTSNHFDIAKEICRTAFRINEPFSANVHNDCLRIAPANGDRLQGEIPTCKVA